MISDCDAELAAFHEGRQEVVHRIYVAHGAALLQHVRRYSGSTEAEGVVQDLFVDLLRNPDLRQRFKGGQLLAWLREIGRLKALAQRRRTNRQVPQELPDIGVSTEGKVEARDLLARFLGGRVSRAQRRFIGLRFLERRTQVEIAAHMRVPRSTLEGWEHGLRSRFRAFVMDDTTDSRAAVQRRPAPVSR